MMQKLNSKLNFTYDTRTSLNGLPVFAIAVHYEEKGQPVSHCLNTFEVRAVCAHLSDGSIPLTRQLASHTQTFILHGGSGKSWKSLGLAQRYGLGGMGRRMLMMPQLLSITMDSKSNNNAMADELARIMPSMFRSLQARVRCMDHIVNIAARCAMLMFDASPEELAKALDEATDNLECMGEDITELSDAPVHDDDEQVEPLELLANDNLRVELGDVFDRMSEEGKEDMRKQVEPMRETISKVRTRASWALQSTDRLPHVS